MKEIKYLKYFEREGLYFARCFGSKSAYIRNHPSQSPRDRVFNARIYLERTYHKFKNTKIKDFFNGMELEVWYGDLNLADDREKLRRVSKDLGTLVITTERGELVEKL